MTLTDTEKGYFAGLLDGEGCVGYYTRFTKGIPYHSASLHICMTDPRPAQWLMEKVGYGKISFSLKGGNRKSVYSWQLCNRSQIQEVLRMLRPFLLVKGDQVDALIRLWEFEENLPKRQLTTSIIEFRQQIADEMKRLKTEIVVFPERVETRRAGSLPS